MEPHPKHCCPNSTSSLIPTQAFLAASVFLMKLWISSTEFGRFFTRVGRVCSEASGSGTTSADDVCEVPKGISRGMQG